MILDDILKTILVFFYQLNSSYGSAIILLSLAVTIIMLPLYWFAEKLQFRELKRKISMQSHLDEIKDLKNKQEKYYYTREIYRKNNYKPYYALTGLIGLAIQLPFFIAAYRMLFNYNPLEGISFGPIKDLSQPDGMLVLGSLSINLLPILMTLINLLGIWLHYRYIKKGETFQLVVIAFVFLVLLYNLSAALVLYWTINNVFAIGRNRFLKSITISRLEDKFLESKVSKLFVSILSNLNKGVNKLKQEAPFGKQYGFLKNFKEVRFYLLLLVIPYIVLVCKRLDVFFISLPILLLLGIFDVIFSRRGVIWKHFYLLIFVSLSIFLYTEAILNMVGFIIDSYHLYSLEIRIRHIFLGIIGFCITFYYWSNHKKIYSVFSIFVIVFSIGFLTLTILDILKKPKNISLVGNNVFTGLDSKYDKKTTILLIFDAYSSPNEIGKIDSTINTEKLVDYLEAKKGWNIKRQFKSLESNTPNSIPSLFNYNLSDPLEPKVYSVNAVGKQSFYYKTKGTSSLIDDLEIKKVRIKNYGMFNLKGANEPDELQIRERHDPESYLKFVNIKSFVPFKKYLENSNMFYTLFQKTLFERLFAGDRAIGGPKKNRILFSLLNESEFKKSDFLVYHFQMPHLPFRYYDEFVAKEGDSQELTYAKFWHFTNNKIINFLDSFNYDNYRIIITGDHGFRKSPNIEQTNTFGAFYGFDKEDVDRTRYVQDIGSLINHCFK